MSSRKSITTHAAIFPPTDVSWIDRYTQGFDSIVCFVLPHVATDDAGRDELKTMRAEPLYPLYSVFELTGSVPPAFRKSRKHSAEPNYTCKVKGRWLDRRTLKPVKEYPEETLDLVDEMIAWTVNSGTLARPFALSAEARRDLEVFCAASFFRPDPEGRFGYDACPDKGVFDYVPSRKDLGVPELRDRKWFFQHRQMAADISKRGLTVSGGVPKLHLDDDDDDMVVVVARKKKVRFDLPTPKCNCSPNCVLPPGGQCPWDHFDCRDHKRCQNKSPELVPVVPIDPDLKRLFLADHSSCNRVGNKCEYAHCGRCGRSGSITQCKCLDDDGQWLYPHTLEEVLGLDRELHKFRAEAEAILARRRSTKKQAVKPKAHHSSCRCDSCVDRAKEIILSRLNGKETFVCSRCCWTFKGNCVASTLAGKPLCDVCCGQSFWPSFEAAHAILGREGKCCSIQGCYTLPLDKQTTCVDHTTIVCAAKGCHEPIPMHLYYCDQHRDTDENKSPPVYEFGELDDNPFNNEMRRKAAYHGLERFSAYLLEDLEDPPEGWPATDVSRSSRKRNGEPQQHSAKRQKTTE